MRKMFTAAAVAAVLFSGVSLTTQSAQAGLTHYTLCWESSWGGSDCVHLPRNYRIPGVRKPRIPDGTVDFVLTRYLISRVLSRYVDTSGMHPAQHATIYAPQS